MKKAQSRKGKLFPPISHLKKPQDLSLEKWQVLLRRQVARDQKFKIKNTGAHPVFSDFSVCNWATNKTYRVSIGGEDLGASYCACPDFALNTLGTCKHIEAVLNKLRRRKETRAALRDGPCWEYSVVTLRYGLERRVAIMLGTSASDQFKNLVNKFFDKDSFLTEQGLRHFEEFVKETAAPGAQVRYHEDAMQFIAQKRDIERRHKRLQEIFPQKTQGPWWDTLLKTELYPYQREGVLFAASAGRSLIADDMGLGKTIQAIATSQVMAAAFGVEKILIVCPSSLKYQWKREIERFTHHSAKIIQGALLKRQRQYPEDGLFKIVNYDVIHRDVDVIASWSPDLIILDEAQRIKNWKTRMARSIKQLKSPYAIVLTGTPLENRLEELHSIVAFIDQHHLGPLFRFLDRHQAIDPDGKMIGYRDLHKLGESLQSIMIRRRRNEVLKELPKRVDKNYFVPLTKEQWEIHDENREIVARLISKWRRYHFLSEEDQKRLMRCLQTMRMVCDNTYLIDQSMRHGQKIDELEIQLKEVFEDPKIKVVIFSQWLRMMELVITMLKANGWGRVFLNGNVPSAKRGDLIKTFHDDPACRIFLSTEAGSTGLNLQNASVVINLDLPWNPAVLEQRISRVHRLGQTQPVRVINFIAEKGIEHGMLGLLKFKQSMFSGVLDQGDNEILMTESRFSRFIKTIEETTGSLPPREEAKDAALELEAAKDKKSAQEEVESAEEISVSALPQEPQASAAKAAPSASTPATEAVQSFLRLGASFLNQLSESLSKTDSQVPVNNSERPDQTEISSGIRLYHDRTTGRRSLHIPIPEEDTLKQVTFILEGFLNLLKR